MTVRNITASVPNGIYNRLEEVSAESKSAKMEACVRIALRSGELEEEIAAVTQERHAAHRSRSDALRG